jgi:hypothetical protein
MLSRPFTIALMISAVVASIGRADVIYSNLNSDPAHLFDSTEAYVAGDGRPFNEKLAMPFMAPGNSTWILTQIDIALHEDLGGSFAALLTLNADATGVPGQGLANWTLNNLPPNPHNVDACCNMASLIVGQTAVSVSGGSKYWLVIQPIGITVADLWFWNNTGANGTSYNADSFGIWVPNSSTTLGAFDVLGVAAPEASPAILLLCGIMTVAALRLARANCSEAIKGKVDLRRVVID